MRFEGRRALVTGASGDLGRAIVSHLSAGGAHVVAHVFSRAERLQELQAAAPDRVHAVRADLTCPEGIDQLVASAQAHLGGLDLLVNSTGGARPRPLAELTLAEWERCLRLNLTVPYQCLRAALELLRDGGGSVVNIASVVAMTGGAFGPHYAAAKAGLVGLTRSAARELGPLGIRVNAVAPGPVASAMTDALAPAALDAILGTTALRRVVSPEEVAEAVAWLAFGASGVTGQTLVVDGGRHFG